VVRRPSGDGTVFADIPGLIAGAAQGAGLGMDFLRHIERTKLLIHLVDCGASEPLADAITLLNELHAYGHGLPERPRITVLSKCELLNPEQQLETQKILEAELNQKVLLISAATGNGLTGLLQAVWLELGIENP